MVKYLFRVLLPTSCSLHTIQLKANRFYPVNGLDYGKSSLFQGVSRRIFRQKNTVSETLFLSNFLLAVDGKLLTIQSRVFLSSVFDHIYESKTWAIQSHFSPFLIVSMAK